MDRTDWPLRSEVAEAFGKTEKTLHRQMQEHGLSGIMYVHQTSVTAKMQVSPETVKFLEHVFGQEIDERFHRAVSESDDPTDDQLRRENEAYQIHVSALESEMEARTAQERISVLEAENRQLTSEVESLREDLSTAAEALNGFLANRIRR